MSLLDDLIWGGRGKKSETSSQTSYPPYPSYPSPRSAGGAAAPADETLGPPLSAYRQALRRFWALAALGAEADAVEVGRIYQEIVRLIDEVGEPEATARRQTWAREWYAATDRCPYCGEMGAFHEVVA
jgi:hypothetical protein